MVNAAKTSSVFIIFGLSVFSGVLSITAVKCLLNKLGVSDKFKRAVSLLNCFSGGVFFATSIMDLFPEAREAMEHALEHYEVHTHYPLTELLVCTGFLLILTMEHVAHACCSRGFDDNHNTRTVDGPTQPTQQPEKNSSVGQTVLGIGSGNVANDNHKHNGTPASNKTITDENAILVRNDFEDTSYVDDITYQTYGTVDGSLDKTSLTPYAGVTSRDATPNETIIFGQSDKIVFRTSPEKVGIVPASRKDEQSVKKAFKHEVEEASLSKLRGLVLMIALSLHMIFDGLALGLMSTESKIWRLLAALSLHKVLVFFTIGIQALEILSSVKKAVVLIIIFAVVSPLGILIGESIASSGDEVSRDTASAILQGIAAGTFLFVTFFEILQRELGNDHHNLVKVFVTIMGFLLVAALRLMEHEHDEDEDGH